MDGAIILDKPAGITSSAAVLRVRKLLGGIKVGHLGTLDPLATGVLPLLVGQATRFSQFYLGHTREYVARIRFGLATTTYDADGDPLTEPVPVSLDATELERLLADFRGSVRQVPPPVSAKKVAGVPAYKRVRNQEPVDLEPLTVEIHELELLAVEGPCAKVRCLCSAGTYIRSLAHDLGSRLGCGAHVAELRRTRVGEFGSADSLTLERLTALKRQDRIREALVSPLDLLPELPVERVDAAAASRIRHGRQFRVSPFGHCSQARLVKAVDPEGRLLCLGRAVSPRLFRPFVVFR